MPVGQVPPPRHRPPLQRHHPQPRVRLALLAVALPLPLRRLPPDRVSDSPLGALPLLPRRLPPPICNGVHVQLGRSCLTCPSLSCSVKPWATREKSSSCTQELACYCVPGAVPEQCNTTSATWCLGSSCFSRSCRGLQNCSLTTQGGGIRQVDPWILRCSLRTPDSGGRHGRETRIRPPHLGVDACGPPFLG